MLGFSTTIYILVSSAKRRILDPMSETMSLIKMRKSNGPKIDPCGTPEDKTFNRLVKNAPFIESFMLIR